MRFLTEKAHELFAHPTFNREDETRTPAPTIRIARLSSIYLDVRPRFDQVQVPETGSGLPGRISGIFIRSEIITNRPQGEFAFSCV
jgi:hypothetical protein